MHHITKDYKTEKGVPIRLHENKIFTVFFNGYYHYIEFHAFAGGAIAIPRFPNGDLLMVRLRRAPAFGMSLEFPRGGIDKGESLNIGVLREVSEETGYTLGPESTTLLGKLGADTATLNGTSSVYLVDIPGDAVQGSYDTEEIDKPVRVTRAYLKQMIKDNLIVDGQTLGAYTMMLSHE